MTNINNLILKIINFFLGRLNWLLKAFIHRGDELGPVYLRLFWGKK